MGNIRVAYVAGFARVPGSVEMAAQLAVSRAVRSVKFGALAGAVGEHAEYSFRLATTHVRAEGVACLPPEALSMLTRVSGTADRVN